MPQPQPDLTLGAGLIRKGEAKGLHPDIAAPAASAAVAAPPAVATLGPETATPAGQPAQRSAPSAPRAPAVRNVPPMFAEDDADDPPLRAVPPDDVPKRFTSFRLSVDLDEALRAMMFETRQSKQDLLTKAVADLVAGWRKSRVKRPA